MPNCKNPIKKPNFKDFCQDIDMDKLFMTDSPFAYSGKWKEACKKNISGKDRGIFSKHERAWIKPKNISKKKWFAMSAKQRGKMMKKLWETEINDYNICAAQESYKKGRKSLHDMLNKKPTPPPLPPSLSKADLRAVGIEIDDTPPPPPFPTELLPPPPPPLSKKNKSRKPKKPSPRKTKKLYLNEKPNLSPNSTKIWGNVNVPSPHTPKGIPPPRTPKGIPPPRTPEGSPDDWDDYSGDKVTPLKLPKGMMEALQRAVGKGSRRKKRKRKNKTKKLRKKKTQKKKKKKVKKSKKVKKGKK